MNGGLPPTGIGEGPLGRCPACGSGRFSAVTNGLETNYRCVACWSCWNVSFGRASRVDPLSCPGCGAAGRCRGTPLSDTGDVPAGMAFPHV